MLSIRSFPRAAPRAVPRLTTAALRTQSARPVSLVQSAWRPARKQCAAAFSTSSTRYSKAAESDEELIQKLKSEIQVEKETAEDAGVPTSIKDYLQNSPFKIIDVPGQEDVILTRQFGGEK
jgi:complement component 1 Q subcomponent-binding protein